MEFEPDKNSVAFLAGSEAARNGNSIDNCYPHTKGDEWKNWLAGFWTVDHTKMPNMAIRNKTREILEGTEDQYLD